jgi:diguanylate cyclase (GGDEF)-like protein
VHLEGFPVGNQRTLKAYEWIIGILGLIILAWIAATQELESSWLLVGCWALSYLLFSDKAVFLTADAAFMPGYPLVIAALSTTGLPGAAWLILTSFLWHGIRNRSQIPRISFNMGSVAIALLAANGIMVAFWGTSNLLEPLSFQGLLRGLVMILTYHVVLTAAHSLLSYITDPELRFTARLTSSLKKSVPWFVPSYYFFSLLLIQLAQTGGIVAILFFLSAIYALWRQFYLSHAYEQESVRAATDSLTGVANREGFRRYLSRTLSPDKLPAAVLFVDIDDFKSLNDRFGHEFGDRALCTVASTLRKSVREEDLIVRWGGEEFIVFLWNTSLEQALSIAERICGSVRECKLPFDAEITVSIGCSGTNNVDEVSRLVYEADHALYRAKHEGKNRVYVAAASE